MCSGNGVHLVYRLTSPMPGGRCSPRDPMAKLLDALGPLFDCEAFKVDPATYTSSRMLKVPGTRVRKGEATPERPHRLARILEVPDGW